MKNPQLVSINDLLAKQASLAYQSVRAQDREFRVVIRQEFDSTVGRMRIVRRGYEPCVHQHRKQREMIITLPAELDAAASADKRVVL